MIFGVEICMILCIVSIVFRSEGANLPWRPGSIHQLFPKFQGCSAIAEYGDVDIYCRDPRFGFSNCERYQLKNIASENDCRKKCGEYNVDNPSQNQCLFYKWKNPPVGDYRCNLIVQKNANHMVEMCWQNSIQSVTYVCVPGQKSIAINTDPGVYYSWNPISQCRI